MPLKRCQENNQRGWRWGDEGKCYVGPDAKEKALQQGRAIGEYEEDEILSKIERLSRYIRKDMRISIDYDGIITNKAIIDILNSLQPFSIKDLFIITNRMDTGMIRLANKLDIPRNRIIRVKDDVQKYNEIINNRIDYHVDNNRDFLNLIGDRGVEIR